MQPPVYKYHFTSHRMAGCAADIITEPSSMQQPVYKYHFRSHHTARRAADSQPTRTQQLTLMWVSLTLMWVSLTLMWVLRFPRKAEE